MVLLVWGASALVNAGDRQLLRQNIAYHQPQTHPLGVHVLVPLQLAERLEELVLVLRVDSHACVPHAELVFFFARLMHLDSYRALVRELVRVADQVK